MSKSKPAAQGERFIIRRDGHVAWILFNRPDRLNAMTIESWGELCELIAQLDKDREVRSLVLAGEGRAFLAGHDVAEIQEHNEDMVAGKLTASQLREWQKNLQNSTKLIRSARFPVIAAVQGYAVGAGCELVFACDLVVAAKDAKFGFPEVNIGVTITNGGTFFMPRKIGLAKARELAYTGEFIDAEEAYRLGLVNRLCAPGEERKVAEALAKRIASRAPVAVQLHKVMLDSALSASLDGALNFETEGLVQTALTRDNLEGTRAFFEKREPKFTGE
ncbi:MAG: enoyl-CoA hydratase/isomerase family protein [Hyphomicrobiaceae bacterium]